MKVRLFLLASALMIMPMLAVSFAQPASPLSAPSARTGLLLTDATTIKLIHNSSGDLAHDYVSQLALWDRSQVTEGFQKAAEWMAQRAREFGLEQVNIERFPSDGTTQYFGNSTERLWKVKKGELWMTSPFEMRLTSYAELPMSLARNSMPADVEADLIDIGRGMSDDDYKNDIKGKIVLTSSNPWAVISRAVHQKGALGVISFWAVPEFDYLNRHPGDYPDQVGWGGIPEPKAEQAGTFAFLISSRRAQELQLLMRQGQTIRVRAVVEAELVPGSLDVVSGIIPGTKYPEEEIVVSAHLDHYKPGASDNASGSASILEMLRTLKHLIDSKQLPPPLRTIRFIWVPEYAGTWAWFSKHINDPVKRVVNLNYDMQGEDLAKTNAVFAISYTPDSNPSYLNALMESILDFMNKYNDDRYPAQKDFHIISIKGSRNRLQGRMMPFMVGTDYEIFNNLKIPGTEVLAWPDNYYHSSEDSPDKVDPTQLHRVVYSGLAAMTTIGYADDPNASDLARQSFVYGKKRIQASEAQASHLLLSAMPENFVERENRAKNLIRHVYQREAAAIRSSQVFARTDASRKSIELTAAMLQDDEAVSRENLEGLATARAAALKLARKPYLLNAAERRASRLFPNRKKDQQLLGTQYVFRKLAADTTMNLQALNVAFAQATNNMRIEGANDLQIWSLYDAAAYYADGQRSILEIRDAVAAEYTPIPVEEIEKYFRAFEKAGVMAIAEK